MMLALAQLEMTLVVVVLARDTTQPHDDVERRHNTTVMAQPHDNTTLR
jgi:hypothetical protein